MAEVGPGIDYNFSRRDQPGANDFNLRWEDINRRFLALEAFMPSWDVVVREFSQDALNRLDDTIVPIALRLQEYASLGFLIGFSETDVNLVVGDTPVWVIAEGTQRTLFTPSPFVVASSSTDWTKYAIVKTIGYNAETGQYQGTIVAIFGATSGTMVTSWSLGAVAGSTLAQIGLYNQGVTARDVTFTARDVTTAARDVVVAAKQSASDSATAAAGSAGSAATSAATATTQAGISTDKAAQAKALVDGLAAGTVQLTSPVGVGSWTLTADQSVFNIPDDFAAIFFYINGSTVTAGAGFTFSGKVVTFDKPIPKGTVVGYMSIRVALTFPQAYTRAEVDAFLTAQTTALNNAITTLTNTLNSAVAENKRLASLAIALGG